MTKYHRGKYKVFILDSLKACMFKATHSFCLFGMFSSMLRGVAIVGSWHQRGKRSAPSLRGQPFTFRVLMSLSTKVGTNVSGSFLTAFWRLKSSLFSFTIPILLVIHSDISKRRFAGLTVTTMKSSIFKKNLMPRVGEKDNSSE